MILLPLSSIEAKVSANKNYRSWCSWPNIDDQCIQYLLELVLLLQIWSWGCLPHCSLKTHQTELQSLLFCNINLFITCALYNNNNFFDSQFLPYLAICSNAWQCSSILLASSCSNFCPMMQRCLKACRTSSLRWLSSTWAQVWSIDCSVKKTKHCWV